jgi:ribosome biogenesis GTPase
MADLQRLGFDASFAAQLAPAEVERVGRVTAEHRGAWEVSDGAITVTAQLAGRLRHEAAETAFPGVGDWVVLRAPPGEATQAIIERVLPRRTVFTRGAAGREAREQVIAANVDLVFVVCGLDADFNVRRIERYLARVWASGAQPAIILTKADLCEEVAARRAEVEGHAPGVAVLVTSAPTGEGLAAERLEHYLALEKEARAFELRHDVRRRRQAERVWGALSDEVAMLRRLKGGKP